MDSKDLMDAWCEAEARWHEVLNDESTSDEEIIQALRNFNEAGRRWLEANA